MFLQRSILHAAVGVCRHGVVGVGVARVLAVALRHWHVRVVEGQHLLVASVQGRPETRRHKHAGGKAFKIRIAHALRGTVTVVGLEGGYAPLAIRCRARSSWTGIARGLGSDEIGRVEREEGG